MRRLRIFTTRKSHTIIFFETNLEIVSEKIFLVRLINKYFSKSIKYDNRINDDEDKTNFIFNLQLRACTYVYYTNIAKVYGIYLFNRERNRHTGLIKGRRK